MKTLVIQTAFPGDAVLTLPLLQEIQKKHPSAEIDVLAIPSTAVLFNANPAVNKVIEFDKRKKDRGAFALLKLIKKLKKENYDIIYSPHRSARSSLITFLLNPKQSYSFDKSALSFLYKTIVEYRSDWHEVRRNLSLLSKSYTDENWKILPRIKVSQYQKEKVNKKLNEINISKFIAIAPGSVWKTKRYPIEYFKSLIKKLTRQNYSIIIIGGQEDFGLGEIIRDENSKIFNFCGEFNLVQSIYLLTKAELLISNDSAPTHLGMCADIPVLTIYCSTVSDFGFYPYNTLSRYVTFNDLECKPCGIHGYNKCPEGHFNCGYLLTHETVLSEALSILEQRHSQHN